MFFSDPLSIHAQNGEKPPRKKLVVLKDEFLSLPSYKKLYLDGDISFEVNLKCIFLLYELCTKKKEEKVLKDSENYFDSGSDIAMGSQ